MVHGFDPGQPLPFHRLVAAADGQRLYLFGRGSNSATPAAVSTDGGQTFTTFDLSTRGAGAATFAPRLPGHRPGDPQVLYFQVFDPQGDQLWRTTDGGQSVDPILQLGRGENLGGFSFGATTRMLYVGALNPFPAAGVAPGHLHVSRDSGASWEAPLPSPLTGPRYRCLEPHRRQAVRLRRGRDRWATPSWSASPPTRAAPGSRTPACATSPVHAAA